MHYGYGYTGGHWGLWITMIVAMAVFLGVLAWIIVTLLRNQGSTPANAAPPSGPTGPPPNPGALDILNERFAGGRSMRRSTPDGGP
jgi:uncharacterized membrane protein